MYYICLALMGIAMAVGLLSYRSLSDAMRVLVWLVTAGVLVEAVAWSITYSGGLNHVAYNLFTLFDGLLVWLIYRKLAGKFSALSTGLVALWLVFICINVVFIQGHQTFFSNNLIAVSLFEILMALAYFKMLLELPPRQSLFSIPGFWFSSALLIYQSVTFFRWTVVSQSEVAELQRFFMHVNEWAVIAQLVVWIYVFRLDATNHGKPTLA
jgi:hypothetical protein